MSTLVQTGSYTRPRRVTQRAQLIAPAVVSTSGDVVVTAVAAASVSDSGSPGVDATVVITGGGPATVTAMAPTPAVTACSTYT